MRRILVVLTLALVAGPTTLSGQVSNAELAGRVAAARMDGADLQTRFEGAAAARLLGDFDAAEELLNDYRLNLNEAENALVNEMILSLSPDHPDPAYRCACLAPKAWVHRVAGRMEESRKLWAELALARDQNPPPADNPQAQGQYARDLARAGRTAEARRVLAAAMAMPVSDEERPAVQRRWAQAYAELGDVAGAVAQLEPLLASSTLVTVNSLAVRYTWEPIRDDPAFQAMLARHR